MKTLGRLLYAVAFIGLGLAASADAAVSTEEWVDTGPDLELQRRAVALALTEFNRHGLDEKIYETHVHRSGDSVRVIFHDTTVVRSEFQFGPASDLLVDLDQDATHILKYHFCCK